MRLPFAFVALALALLATGCGGGEDISASKLDNTGSYWNGLSQNEKERVATYCPGKGEATPEQVAEKIDAFYDSKKEIDNDTIETACQDEDSIQSGLAGPDPKPDSPDPRGSYKLTCDYLLGEEVDSYTLIGGGTVENVGNVEIQVRVKVKWEQLGAEPIRDEQTFSLRVGKRKRVSFNMPTTSDVIDRLQSAAGPDCSINATIGRSSGADSKGSVSEAAARLGLLCLDRAKGETVDQGEIDARANDLISAYEESGKDREERDFMRVARDNMESGCGPQLVDDFQRAIDESR